MNLVVKFQGLPFKEVPLRDEKISLGADAADDVLLLGDNVSPRHAEIRQRHGQWILLDQASESGVMVDGQRANEVVMAPGVVAMIGPFEILVESDMSASSGPARATAAPDEATMYARPTHAILSDETLHSAPGDTRPGTAPRAAVTPSRGTPHAPVKRKKAAPPDDNIVAKLARLPKPVLFAGFSFLMLLILALKVLTSTSSESETVRTESGAPTTTTAPDNNQVIARHVDDARARMKRGEFEAALKENIEPILLIDKTHATALSLKAEAEELLARAATAKPAATTQPEPPTGPPPATAPGAAKASNRAAATELAASRRPPPPERGGVTVRPEEAPEAWQARMTALGGRYEAALAAIRADNHDAAAAELDAIVREEPKYRDAAQRLAQLRQTQSTGAKTAFDAALALMQDEEWGKARTELLRACAMPQASPGCPDAKRQLTDRMQTAAADALRRAKSFDAQGRLPEAIALYQRAVDLLAADDPNRAGAQERLAALKARR